MNTQFRIYEDGSVVHQDDFAEHDRDPQHEILHWEVVVVPDIIVGYLLRGCRPLAPKEPEASPKGAYERIPLSEGSKDHGRDFVFDIVNKIVRPQARRSGAGGYVVGMALGREFFWLSVPAGEGGLGGRRVGGWIFLDLPCSAGEEEIKQVIDRVFTAEDTVRGV